MREINISFTEEEINAVVALIDAALRANGINALNASYTAIRKIETAKLEAYKALEENKN